MNFGTPVPLLVGLILIVGAIGLFFLDKLKPGYERSTDKVYAVLILLAGILLLVDLNMDLPHSLQQVLLVGMLTTLFVNDLTKRESNRNRPTDRTVPPQRYDDRPPRRVYRAELDDWDTPEPRQPRIPSDRYNDKYGDRHEPRPLESRPPYGDRQPPARLQPGQSGRPDERFDSYTDERGRPETPYPNRRYDGGGAPQSPNNRPQRPAQRPPQRSLDAPVSAGNGAGHSLGGLPHPPTDTEPRNESRSERPPLNVRPRPDNPGEKGTYTDFRPAPPTDGDASDPRSDVPPPQPPVNY